MSDYNPFDLDAFLNQPPVARCNRCGRAAWNPEDVGQEDRMTQPDGNPCGGRFVSEKGAA